MGLRSCDILRRFYARLRLIFTFQIYDSPAVGAWSIDMPDGALARDIKYDRGITRMKKTIMVIIACALSLTLTAACGGAFGGTGPQDPPSGSVQDLSDGPVPGSPDAPAQNAPVQNAPVQNAPATDSPPAGGESPAGSSFDTSRVIAVFTREEGSGTRDAFASLTGVGEDMYVEAVVESETNQILTKVEENEYAISYVSVGSLNPKVKALALGGVVPSNETIIDGSYALQRPFLVCVNAENESDALVRDFIDFIASAEGQAVVATKWTKIIQNARPYAPSGLSGALKVGGSTSVEPLMGALRQAYIALNPGVDIEISGGGSGTGISEATSGVLNIGMSSRALKDNEKEALTGIEIALDGVAVIVNPANPISGITIEQVKGIFTGETTRWNGIE